MLCEIYQSQYSKMSLEELCLQAWRFYPPSDDKRWRLVKASYHQGNLKLMASILDDELIMSEDVRAKCLREAIRKGRGKLEKSRLS